MSDMGPMVRSRWRQRLDYQWLVDLLEAHSVLESLRRMLAAGDQVLLRTAESLRAAADSDALVARSGGEEFVIAGHLRDGADVTAQRLRRAVASMSGLPVAITASVGIVVFDACRRDTRRAETICRDLLRRADRAMYAAKRLGGNAIVVARENPAWSPCA
ncbi:GGDEF domain-containing protein [Nocardia terpenica]|uniref:GGDEF domain-containing protein n=1 Tax=Nocardia terpenica TaxID=455432 RepID=UPI002FE417D5